MHAPLVFRLSWSVFFEVDPALRDAVG